MKQNFILDAGKSLETEHLINSKKEKDVIIKHFLLTEKDEKIFQNRKGDYFTISFTKDILYENKLVLEKMKNLLNAIFQCINKFGL